VRVRVRRLVRRAAAVCVTFTTLAHADGKGEGGGAAGVRSSLNPGLTIGAGLHDRGAAPGLEVSFVRYAERDNGFLTFGPLVQASLPARSDDASSTRYARLVAGGEIAWTALGIEACYAFLSGSSEATPTHAVHLAPFLSLGILSIAAPLTLPFASAGTGHPVDFGITFAAKFPLLFTAEGVRGWWALLGSMD
jgi:hypothetical protein